MIRNRKSFPKKYLFWWDPVEHFLSPGGQRLNSKPLASADSSSFPLSRELYSRGIWVPSIVRFPLSVMLSRRLERIGTLCAWKWTEGQETPSVASYQTIEAQNFMIRKQENKSRSGQIPERTGQEEKKTCPYCSVNILYMMVLILPVDNE